MNCIFCQSTAKKNGKDINGNQRYRCNACTKTFSDQQEKPLGKMYLPIEKAGVCISLLMEGMSLRSVERLTAIDINTLMKLLVIVGQKCEVFLDSRIKNVRADDVECDELWCFVGMKEKTLKERVKYMDNIEWEEVEKLGDAYTFVGFERNTKLVLAWHLGRRTAEDTWQFSKKLARATSDDSFQITTDGFAPYRDAIVRACESKGIDFAQLTKVYAAPRDGEARYSPPVVVDVITSIIHGNPAPGRICTSIVERQNLTIRMQMRRFTRLTNAFSKKWENLKAALALFFAFYNYCRKHGGIEKQTPAMAAGLTDHVWTVRELLTAL